MGRVTSIDFPSGTSDITKAYDNNGNLTSVTRNGIVWTYDYNNLDALTLERLQLDSRTYEFTYGYTPEGFLTSATLPWVSSVSFSPNGLGQATGLTVNGNVLASGGAYFINGGMSALTLGNGFAFTATQNSRQLIATSKTIKGTTKAFDASYAYDTVLPRIASVTDNTGTGEYARSVGYDALNRVTSVTGPWGSSAFTYDSLGNMRKQVIGSRTIDINYDTTNRVSQYRDTAVSSSWNSVAHDPRGNVTTKGGLGFVYDYANQPTSVSGSATATYTYDGNLKRVKSFEGGETTYSAYSSLTGKISVIDNPTSGDRFSILNFGPVSIRVSSTGTVEYTHLDHLGSAIGATSNTGSLLWRESYLPFGEKRLDPAGNRDKPGYTGHIEDDATGLTYMQARYYDPVLGRFLSTDPVGYQDQMNLYAYVANDPINKIDPSGTKVETEGDCSRKCTVVDNRKEQVTGSLFKRTVRTELGTYTPIEGTEKDSQDEGTTRTDSPMSGTTHWLYGSGTKGAENIDTKRMHSYAAKRLGQSYLNGTIRKLISNGGGRSNDFSFAGDTGDWTAGSVQFNGEISVTLNGPYFAAAGFVTALDEMYDFNSNPGRGKVGNAGVVSAGVAGNVLSFGRAKTFVQTYYGTLNFQFTGAIQ